jgi:hypothetical protein
MPANNTGRMGHGLGLQFTEPPSNMSDDHTVLEEGVVITIEPGVEYEQGKMIVHEENVVITSSGAEPLTRRAPCVMSIWWRCPMTMRAQMPSYGRKSLFVAAGVAATGLRRAPIGCAIPRSSRATTPHSGIMRSVSRIPSR